MPLPFAQPLILKWPLTINAMFDPKTYNPLPGEIHLFVNEKLAREIPFESFTDSSDRIDSNSGAESNSVRSISIHSVELAKDELFQDVSFSTIAFLKDAIVAPRSYYTVSVENRNLLKGRAFIISVGVDEYTRSDWNLRWAAQDADLLNSALIEFLENTNDYSSVLGAKITSSGVSESAATTRTSIDEVFSATLGQPTSLEVLQPIAASIAANPIGPSDVVFFTFSGHGLKDENGEFHLVMTDSEIDIGAKPIFRKTVTTSEFESWLPKLSGAQVVLILDACYSASAFESDNYSLGPLDNRGLSRLSYRHGLQVLAASQADFVAIESDNLEQGLLAYTLRGHFRING